MLAFKVVTVPVDRLRSAPRSITGFGSTVIKVVTGKPMQPFAIGVMAIVPATGEGPGLIAVKEEILPVPLEDRPIDEALLVQLKLVPVTLPVKLIALVLSPAQSL